MQRLNQQQLRYFNTNSVLHLKSLFPKETCEEVRMYFLENERQILAEYSTDKRGLVAEVIGGNISLKYFEFPLHYNSTVFGQFLTSNLFEIGCQLLGSPVRFVSAEIHSRYGGASEIPMHQDNAYYGLLDGAALTFYIAIDSQSASTGGLQYISNPTTDEFEHIPCESSAFSLTIAKVSLLNQREIIQPVYDPGDCTVHHSRSVHFADCAPISSGRSIVFRVSLYSVSSAKRSGHDQWYEDIIRMNRSSFGG